MFGSSKITKEEDSETAILMVRKKLVAPIQDSSSNNSISENDNSLSSELSDDDILRFLRARSYDINAAIASILAWDAWRKAPITASKPITAHSILFSADADEAVYARLLPHSNLGHDKGGRPIYFEKTGLISGRMTEILSILSPDDIIIRHVRQQELMIKRLQIASMKAGYPIEKQVIVFDLKGLSYSLNTAAMSLFRRTIEIDQAYYPERLQYFFMVNAPWFFTAIFAMIKPWLDKITAEKFKILGSDYLPTLEKFIDIEQIPEELGGKRENFAWHYPDNFDESAELAELLIAKNASIKISCEQSLEYNPPLSTVDSVDVDARLELSSTPSNLTTDNL